MSPAPSTQMNWNCQCLLNFFALATIRGGTPIMMYFAVVNLHSPSLVVFFKCMITLIAFMLSSSWYIRSNGNTRSHILSNVRDKTLYWRLGVIGLLQGGIPNLLLTYSIQYFPPTLIGVFTVTSPWWSFVLRWLPFLKFNDNICWTKKAGIGVGIFGILMFYIPVLTQSLYCHIPPTVYNSSNGTIPIPQTLPMDSCLTGMQLILATLALILAPSVWGCASIFWKAYQHETHYLVSSVGQNLFGGLFALIVWFTEKNYKIHQSHWSSSEAVPSVLYLGLIAGWLATLLVHHMLSEYGAVMTNQVVVAMPIITFLLDCMFVRGVVTSHGWLIAVEIFAVLLLCFGAFMFNLPAAETKHPYTEVNTDDSLFDPLLDQENSFPQGIGNNLNDIPSVTSPHEESEEELNNVTNAPPIMRVT